MAYYPQQRSFSMQAQSHIPGSFQQPLSTTSIQNQLSTSDNRGMHTWYYPYGSHGMHTWQGLTPSHAQMQHTGLPSASASNECSSYQAQLHYGEPYSRKRTNEHLQHPHHASKEKMPLNGPYSKRPSIEKCITAIREGLSISFKIDFFDDNVSANGYDSTGNTLLHYAVYYDRLFIGCLLLERGASPELCNYKGERPDAYLTHNSHPVWKLAFSHIRELDDDQKRAVGETVCIFLRRENYDAAAYILRKAPYILNVRIEEGEETKDAESRKQDTILTRAIARKDHDVINWLMANWRDAIDPNMPGKLSGSSYLYPIHFAAYMGSEQILSLLLSHPKIKLRIRGNQLIIDAMESENADVVLRLLNMKGVKVQSTNKKEKQPLQQRILYEKLPSEVLKRLLEAGARLRTQDQADTSPIDLAIHYGGKGHIYELLRHNCYTVDYVVPLAINNHNLELIHLALEFAPRTKEVRAVYQRAMQKMVAFGSGSYLSYIRLLCEHYARTFPDAHETFNLGARFDVSILHRHYDAYRYFYEYGHDIHVDPSYLIPIALTYDHPGVALAHYIIAGLEYGILQDPSLFTRTSQGEPDIVARCRDVNAPVPEDMLTHLKQELTHLQQHESLSKEEMRYGRIALSQGRDDIAQSVIFRDQVPVNKKAQLLFHEIRLCSTGRKESPACTKQARQYLPDIMHHVITYVTKNMRHERVQAPMIRYMLTHFPYEICTFRDEHQRSFLHHLAMAPYLAHVAPDAARVFMAHLSNTSVTLNNREVGDMLRIDKNLPRQTCKNTPLYDYQSKTPEELADTYSNPLFKKILQRYLRLMQIQYVASQDAPYIQDLQSKERLSLIGNNVDAWYQIRSKRRDVASRASTMYLTSDIVRHIMDYLGREQQHLENTS